ncbi:MAG: YggT family protein [Gemmatimonadota bacterium]
MESVIINVVQGVRFFVAGAFVLSLVVWLTHWGVRKGSISPFGAWAKFVRRWSDPLLRPIERRLVRSGANPQDAPAWLIGVTVVGGLVLIGVVDWIIGFGLTIYENAAAGALLPTVVHSLFELLKLAVMIRVIVSWINISPYSTFMRIINGLTDWLIDPIRKILPTIGMFDFSPLVAYVVLSFGEQIVMRGLF